LSADDAIASSKPLAAFCRAAAMAVAIAVVDDGGHLLALCDGWLRADWQLFSRRKKRGPLRSAGVTPKGI